MRFGSVCSGIEAASVAWHPLGWEAAWLSEIEPFPSAVLAHHYPDVPNLGDMTTLPDRIRAGEVDAPDLFCGGTPCQAFSVAGLRKSLDDARGNLSLTFCEIADAIDHARSVHGQPGCIVFWENVPGVLSTPDNAFGCFLAQLCGGDEPLVAPDGWPNAGCVSGPSRTAAWRVLDAQYFGLAQRRRRVFVVASSRNDFDPAAVLFEFGGVRRDFAPSRETRQSVAGTLEASLGRSRGAGTLLSGIAAARMVAFGEYVDDGTASAMKARDYKDATDLIAFDTTQITSATNRSNPKAGDPCHTLSAGADAPTIAFHPTQDPISSDNVCHAIGTGSGEGCATAAVAYKTQCKHCIKFFSQYQCSASTHGECDCPKCQGYCECHQEEQPAICIKGAAIGRKPEAGPQYGETLEEMAYTQNCVDVHGVLTPAMQVRRLTPRECERLQGFPDDYTAIPWRGKPADQCPDGPRYKALGNSWAVPVVRWIGRRIAEAA